MEFLTKFAVYILGIAFLFIFSAFQTCEMIQEIILESFGKKFDGVGFKSLSIIYASFAIFNWFSAPIVNSIGPVLSLAIGSITYCVFIGSFLKPYKFVIYATSFLLGVGASILWTAQGAYLTLISNNNNISKNTGIFWALFQGSFIIGNLLVFLKFQHITHIDANTSFSIFLILFVLCTIGFLTIILFIKTPKNDSNSEREPLLNNDRDVPSEELSNNNADKSSYLPQKDNPQNILRQTFRTSINLLKDKNVQLLVFPFGFTGLNLTFITGVLITCVGYTSRLGNLSKPLMGISGISLGVGEIIGALNFGVLSEFISNNNTVRRKLHAIKSKLFCFMRTKSDIFTVTTNNDENSINNNNVITPHFTRSSNIVFIGFILNCMAYFVIYLCLPQDSPINESFETVYISNNLATAIIIPISALLFGVADSAFNTQIYVILATYYKTMTVNTAIFALFRFVQSAMAAIAFYYCKYLFLHWQLLILVMTQTLAIICFFRADKNLTCHSQN